jgi:hypothetical protein
MTDETNNTWEAWAARHVVGHGNQAAGTRNPRAEFKTIPTRFIVSDDKHAKFKTLVENLTPDMPATRKALIQACPPELIGTAWDPMMATGEPVAPAMKHKRRKPLRIATFPC